MKKRPRILRFMGIPGIGPDVGIRKKGAFFGLIVLSGDI